ncbi:Protein CBG13840 [Caenorhabditis briggsae]|uniref:Protein CBG13840 n=1 Tax=Caenorhabditis briggsae TaxID=6238 RepID=A8XIT9_CAEBR|nr:Protein CBG13840 [Caenorhabditis briggsae]CAP32564.2 Protein CBG13840 [Caenorhabditis briggsae]
MNRLIEYGSVDEIPYYNCSSKSQNEWLATGVKRPWLGYPITVFGVFIELPAFKIDLSRLDGGFAIATWCMSCSVTTSLFLNRVISVAFHGLSNFIEKRLAYICICLCVFYGFYVLFFTPVVCFNSEWLIWLPDPLSETKPSDAAADYYRNSVQAWNNWIFVICMFVLFSLYLGMINKISMGQKSKAAKSIFIQCCIICFFNTVIALVYNALTLITPDYWMLLLCQFCWSVNHGCPVLIYVTMNATVKREFKKMVLGGDKRIGMSVSNTHAASVTQMSTH